MLHLDPSRAQQNRLLIRRFDAKWRWIGTDMKDVWSLAIFAIGALCLVTFVTTVKPDAIKAVPASSKSEHWKRQACGARGCRVHVFAAVRSRLMSDARTLS